MSGKWEERGRIEGGHYGEQSGTTGGIRRTPGKGGASPVAHGQAVTATLSEDLIRSSEMHAALLTQPPVCSPTASPSQTHLPHRGPWSSWNPSLVITNLLYQRFTVSTTRQNLNSSAWLGWPFMICVSTCFLLLPRGH